MRGPARRDVLERDCTASSTVRRRISGTGPRPAGSSHEHHRHHNATRQVYPRVLRKRTGSRTLYMTAWTPHLMDAFASWGTPGGTSPHSGLHIPAICRARCDAESRRRRRAAPRRERCAPCARWLSPPWEALSSQGGRRSLAFAPSSRAPGRQADGGAASRSRVASAWGRRGRRDARRLDEGTIDLARAAAPSSSGAAAIIDRSARPAGRGSLQA